MSKTVWDIINSKQDGGLAVLAPYREPLTYGGFKAQILHTTNQLYNYGLDEESRVGVVVHGAEMGVMTMAAMSFFVANPFSVMNKADELEKYFRLCGTKILVTSESCPDALAAAENVGIPVIYLRQRIKGSVGSFSLFNRDGQELKAGQSAIIHPSAEDYSLFLLTSGTTSDPKVVPIRHRNLYASAKGLAEDMGLNSGDMALNPGMPLHHAGGLGVNFLTSFYVGGSVYLLPDWQGGRGFADIITENPITWMTAIDGHYRAIAKNCTHDVDYAGKVRNSRIKVYRIGSTPSTGELVGMVTDMLPNARPLAGFGMTEATGYIGYQLTDEDIASHRQSQNNEGFLCRLPRNGVDIKIIGADGNPVLDGTPGELVIRGDKVITEYLVTPSDPDVNQNSFTSDGYLKTGDLVVERDGVLYIVGRCKDTIRVNAQTVIPAEVEEVLKRHELLKNRPVYVFGIPHNKSGQAVGVVIQVEGEYFSEPEKRHALYGELKRMCQMSLESFKVPGVWVIADQVPTAGLLGKISRSNLHMAFELHKLEDIQSPRKGSSFLLTWSTHQDPKLQSAAVRIHDRK